MMKDLKNKRQVIDEKIQSKYFNFRLDQQRRNKYQPVEILNGGNQDESEGEEDYNQCINNYTKSMNDLNDYIVEQGNNADGEYTHKLLFDFYRYQATFYNMQQDEDLPELYSKYTKPPPLQKKQTQQGTPIFQQIDNDDNSFKQIQRKMSMKDKLQLGRFCFYDQIPRDNQIEQYKSISSEEQILERDSLSDLFEKMDNKNQMCRLKNIERKHREKQKKQNQKVKKMLRNTRYSEQYLDSQLNSVEEDQEQLNRKIFKMQEREKVAKKIKQQRLRREKVQSKYQNKSSNHFQQDSSNQVNFDSQQSDDEADDNSDEDGSQEQQNDNQQQDLNDKEQEHFKHLDEYEQVLDFGQSDQFEFIGGKQKIVRGVEQYHSMKKNQKDKYFRKMYRDYEYELRKQMDLNRRKKRQSKRLRIVNKKKNVSFSDSVYYKSFNTNGKPNEVKLTDEKQEIVIKAIWEYDD